MIILIFNFFILLAALCLFPQIIFFFDRFKRKDFIYKEVINGEDFNFLGTNNLSIHGKIYRAENERAFVQIIHGALEHKERYLPFINFLLKNGYSVVISDNRGHGASVNKLYPYGYMNFWEEIIEDQLMISNFIKIHYNKDIFLVGHSLGSIFARLYLEDNDFRIKKLVLTGTVSYNPLVGLGIFIGNILNFYMGTKSRSRLLNRLYNGGRKIEWLSYNKKNIEEAKKDPLMLKFFRNKGALTVFRAMKELRNIKNYKCQNKNLEILSITGEDDEVVGSEEKLKDSLEILRKIGYTNISYRIMKGMKHEVLREEENEKVFKIILDFFEGRGLKSPQIE